MGALFTKDALGEAVIESFCTTCGNVGEYDAVTGFGPTGGRDDVYCMDCPRGVELMRVRGALCPVCEVREKLSGNGVADMCRQCLDAATLRHQPLFYIVTARYQENDEEGDATGIVELTDKVTYENIARAIQQFTGDFGQVEHGFLLGIEVAAVPLSDALLARRDEYFQECDEIHHTVADEGERNQLLFESHTQFMFEARDL